MKYVRIGCLNRRAIILNKWYISVDWSFPYRRKSLNKTIYCPYIAIIQSAKHRVKLDLKQEESLCGHWRPCGCDASLFDNPPLLCAPLPLQSTSGGSSPQGQINQQSVRDRLLVHTSQRNDAFFHFLNRF